MSDLGLCINSNGAVPSRNECLQLGIGDSQWLRTPIQGPLSLLDDMMNLIDDDINIFVMVNTETEGVGNSSNNWDGFESVLYKIVSKPYAKRIKAIGCGNELDLWHQQAPVGPNDPHLTPAFAASLVRRAAPILRPWGIKVVATSVASGDWYNYLKDMSALCRDEADYFDLHLYVKSTGGIPVGADWQDAIAALTQARAICGKPVICSEAGIKVDDAGGLNNQGLWVESLLYRSKALDSSICPALMVFAWSDGIGTGAEQGGQAFGLRGADGKPKPAWFAFQKVCGGPLAAGGVVGGTPGQGPLVRAVFDPSWRFQQGFLKWSKLEPELIGKPAEAVEFGSVNGVSQQMTTLDGSTYHGILTWVNLYRPDGPPAAYLTFLRLTDGARFLWREEWPSGTKSVRITTS